MKKSPESIPNIYFTDAEYWKCRRALDTAIGKLSNLEAILTAVYKRSREESRKRKTGREE